MPDSDKRNALDHVVVVLFENRSFDNVLGRLYGPGDGKTFDGVLLGFFLIDLSRTRSGTDFSPPTSAWSSSLELRFEVQVAAARLGRDWSPLPFSVSVHSFVNPSLPHDRLLSRRPSTPRP